ncbi:MAG: hypothetical protein ACLFQW_03815 [Spirochaetaceae bacterium]
MEVIEMQLEEHLLVYPEGDEQEIDTPLRFNQLVGLNGVPVQLPLPSAKTIVYRVYKVSRREKKGETLTYYHLELVTGEELRSLAD